MAYACYTCTRPLPRDLVQGVRRALSGVVPSRLGVADGGAAIKAAALKKLQGDVEVDQSTRAKVAVRAWALACCSCLHASFVALAA